MWRRITNSDTLFRFVTAGRRLPAGLIFPNERANVTDLLNGRHSIWSIAEKPGGMGTIPQY